MSETGKTAICILSGLMLCVGAEAIIPDSANPYQGIVDRNVFGLKPMALVPTNTPPPPVISPLELSGITTILHPKKALINLKPAGKPVQSFILGEGQRDGDIEVLEIDEKAGSVKVNQAGTVTTLTFEKNGVKLPAAVASAPPGGNAGGFVPPLAQAYNPAGGQPGGGLKPIPSRQMRVPATADTAASNAGGFPGSTSAGSASTGYGSPGFQAQIPAAAPAMSHEEQIILMEANHQIAQASGDESAKLFPPTELNPTRNTDQAQQNANPSPVGQTPQQSPVNLPPRNPGLPRLPQ